MNRSKVLCLTIAVTLSMSPAMAGPLASDPNALQIDGAIWQGSTPFSSGDLAGFVDWAAFYAVDAPAGLDSGAPRPLDFIYTYQVYVTGTAPITSFSIEIRPGANIYNIGTFTAPGVDGQPALTTGLIPHSGVGELRWTFDGLLQDEFSVGLVLYGVYYQPPLFAIATTLSLDGDSALAIPVGGPGDNLPEPSTLALGALSFAGLAAWGWRRKL